MRIIAISTLKSFWYKYPDCEQSLKTWYHEVKKMEWGKPNDVKEFFRSADILPNDRIVFNIKGNHYRLIVKVHYIRKVCYIRFIGTHKEYDKIDAANI
jgi:mRNA interferase HigB